MRRGLHWRYWGLRLGIDFRIKKNSNAEFVEMPYLAFPAEVLALRRVRDDLHLRAPAF